MDMDWWQQVGLICGVIIAVASVLGLAARGVKRMWRLL